MKAKIYFHKPDAKAINEKGWNCLEGDIHLRLTFPLKQQEKDSNIKTGQEVIPEALDTYQYLGALETDDNPDSAFLELQNRDENGHQFKNRSMTTGDIVVLGKTGYFCKRIGWSVLTPELLALVETLDN